MSNLLSNSIWIFISLVFLLLLAAVFPSPAIIGISLFCTSFLVVLQAVIILKDK